MSKISSIINQSPENKQKTNYFVHLNEDSVMQLQQLHTVGLEKNNQDKETVDYVNHPSHYATVDPMYEPINVINAWNLNFNIGNAVKYLSRYKKKWNPIEDLKKAVFYIEDEIARLEKKDKNTSSHLHIL